MSAPSTQNPDALLPRALGTPQLAAGIFNYTVGSGIFVLPAAAVAALGTAAPLAYVTCAVLIALVVLCLAEAGSRVAATGGPYAYVEAGLGPIAGCIAGVLLFLTGLNGAAAVCTAFAASVAALLGVSAAWFKTVMITGVFALLAGLNVRGVRTGARLVEVATLAKLVPLISFVIIGIFFVDPARLRWEVLPSASAVLQASGVLIFAFCGIESALIPSGEVRTPARTVPVAAFIAIGASTALYLAIHCVAQGVLGTALADDRVTPLATAAGTFAGPVGRTFMIVGAALSMFGYLSFAALAGPRSLFAFARDGLLPHGLAAVHERYRTPWVAIVTYCALGVVLATAIGSFESLAVLANLSAIVLYAMCAVSAWVLRRRGVRLAEEPFVTPGGPLIPVLTCAGLAWLFFETFTRDYLVASVVTIIAVVILYGVRALRGKASAVST